MSMACSSLKTNRCQIHLQDDLLNFTVDHDCGTYYPDSRALINYLVWRSDFDARSLPFAMASYFMNALTTKTTVALLGNRSFDVTMIDSSGISFYAMMLAQKCSPYPRPWVFSALLERPEINPNESILQSPWLRTYENINRFHHPVALLVNNMYSDYATMRTLLDCPQLDMRFVK